MAMHDSGSLRQASRLARLEVSPILSIGALANEMRRAGRPVIVLGAGEPDFDTPEHIKEAAARALRDGATKYTALDGTAELKDAIREKFRRDNGLVYAHEQIAVCAGAKQAIFNAFMATIDPGDEVVIAAPYWATYADIVLICGGRPVFAPTAQENGFRLQPEDLAKTLTRRTRWLLLNAPSNPAGAVYSATDLERLLDVVRAHPNVWTLSDDIYEHILYDGRSFATAAAVAPDLQARILTLNGVSKSYAMTGWRIGYAAGPASLINAMAVVQSQSTSCPSSIGQAAAVAALGGPQDIVRERCAIFQRRRDMLVAMLDSIGGLACRRPEGAFYAYVDCRGVLGKRTVDGKRLDTDADFCSYLLAQHNVAVVPGSAFGLSPYFRVSYAASDSNLVEACRRIAGACAALS